jgi:Leucine-rich repeat (LRR) protein
MSSFPRIAFLLLFLFGSCSKDRSSGSEAMGLLLTSGSSGQDVAAEAQTSPLPEIFPAPQTAPEPPAQPDPQPAPSPEQSAVLPATPVAQQPSAVPACTPGPGLRVDQITFADATLRQCVLNTGATLASEITTLQCPAQWIQSASGLECLTSLKELNLQNNRIANFAPIKDLSALVELRIGYMLVNNPDFSPVGELTGLEILSIGGNHKLETLPIEKLSNLSKLEMHGSKSPIDLSRITGLQKLKHLGLAANKLSDISQLAAIPSLEVLQLQTNLIRDVRPLGELKLLKSLDLWGNKIQDLNGLSGASRIERLVLAYNNIQDLAPISSMQSIKELEISHNDLADIAPLGQLSNLEVLGAGSNPIVDVAVLGRLQKLRVIGFAQNYSLNLTTMPKLESLKELALTSSRINNIEPLVRLPNLETLFLSENNLEQIEPLRRLTKLKRLDISVNPVADISPLSSLTEMTHLTAEFTPIEELSAIQGLSKLERLAMYGADVVDVSGISSMTWLVRADFGEGQIRRGGAALVNLPSTYLFLYGNDRMPCADVEALRSSRPASLQVLPERCGQSNLAGFIGGGKGAVPVALPITVVFAFAILLGHMYVKRRSKA